MDEFYVGGIDTATIPTKKKYTPPKQPHYNQDKTPDFIIKLLQFLVPLMILGLAVGLRFYSKSQWKEPLILNCYQERIMPFQCFFFLRANYVIQTAGLYELRWFKSCWRWYMLLFCKLYSWETWDWCPAVLFLRQMSAVLVGHALCSVDGLNFHCCYLLVFFKLIWSLSYVYNWLWNVNSFAIQAVEQKLLYEFIFFSHNFWISSLFDLSKRKQIEKNCETA